jgi:transcription elongation GreA/GreB family factor
MASNDVPDATVQPGSRVRIHDGDREQVVHIRDDRPASWAVDSISANTPMARALIGHRAGDEVTIDVHPAVPVRKVTILGIE